jgi:hypothetical protein
MRDLPIIRGVRSCECVYLHTQHSATALPARRNLGWGIFIFVTARAHLGTTPKGPCFMSFTH